MNDELKAQNMKVRKANPNELKLHSLSKLIPDMRGSEWQDFYADIALRGIKVPLEVLADGTVLDGRHRLKAALQLTMKEVPIVDAPLNGDKPEVYMMKAAVLRRHLSDDQRSCIAVLWTDEEKKTAATQPRDEKGKFIAEPEPLTPQGCQRSKHKKNRATQAKATKQFRVSQTKIEKARKVKKDRPDLFEKVHQGDIALSNAYKQVKGKEERQRIESTKPPEGLYQVIVIDPPWPFTSRQNDPTHEIASPYESMTIDALKSLKIPACEDSIIWLWTTNTFLHDAFHLLEAWGFTYRTTLTWAKNFVGLGDWLGGQTEHCLMATKGSYKVFRRSESTLLESPRTRHSEKPDKFYDMLSDLCPGSRIDLFARKERPGWDTWGVEVNQQKIGGEELTQMNTGDWGEREKKLPNSGL